MRHYPHPYKETPDPVLLSTLVVLLALGALLAGSWRAWTRAQQRRAGGRSSRAQPLR